MRILYASARPPYPFFLGGAARSAHYLMSVLTQELGAQCMAVGSAEYSGTPWSAPSEEDFASLGVSSVEHAGSSTTVRLEYPVATLPDFDRTLPKVIDDFRPDVVWVQLDGIVPIARIARAAGCGVVAYLRDADDPPAMIKRLASLGCSLVGNSEFMARRVQRLTGRRAHVIYPTLEAPYGVRGDPNGYVTMINPHKAKGIDTFLQIAALMPEQRFLAVESWRLNEQAWAALCTLLQQVPNMRLQRRVADVSEVYKATRLLLVPSICEEAFGRVVIEAQSCRIPVIASDRGGLPEAVSDGGICIGDYANPDAWVREITRLLGDEALYGEIATRAQAHSDSVAFSTRHAAAKLLAVCTEAASTRRHGRGGLSGLLDRITSFGRG